MDYGAEYSRLHEKYPKFFAGFTLKRYVEDVAAAVKTHDAKTLLDYGSGKGYQYLVRRYHERWGGILPVCYDIGVRQLNVKPLGTFDGVICTDMLEHIEEKDVPSILDELVEYAFHFVVLGISCRAEKKDVKQLSDGRGVHVCVKPPKWWSDQIKQARARALALASKGDTYKPPVVYCIYETEGEPLERETIT